MPCYHPLHAYKGRGVNEKSGKRSMVFRMSRALLPLEYSPLPCGKCVGCKLEYSRQWAMRILQENQLHQDSAFVTLTYATVPPGGTLVPKDLQDFMKRLRRRRPPKSVHFFACGEYGEQKRRPHYHAILFGVRFPDQQFYSQGADGSLLYTSNELAHLWPAGFSTVGAVTFESAAYVARYCVKKLSFYGEDQYEHIDPDTGEVLAVHPEFARMSLKPAIGKEWFKEFRSDVYPSDDVVVRGRQMKPPKYYDKLLELEDPESLAAIKLKRLGDSLEHAHDRTTRRLRDREQVKLAQLSQLKRGVE